MLSLRSICFLVCIGLFSPFAHAFYGDGLLVNSVALDFNFTEYDENGATVTEKGLLGGVEMELGHGFGPVWGGVRGSYVTGVADYDGQKAINNEEHQTKTEETIYDVSLEIGRNYETWRREEFATIYAGFGLHQWLRDIKTHNNTIGPFERYTWLYANVGARGFLFRTTHSHTMIEINLLRTIKPILDIGFKGKYDDQRVYLGEHYGAKISIPWRYEISRRFMLYSEVFFEAWDLGFSNVAELTKEGFAAGATQEPRSASRFRGLIIGLFIKFD